MLPPCRPLCLLAPLALIVAVVACKPGIGEGETCNRSHPYAQPDPCQSGLACLSGPTGNLVCTAAKPCQADSDCPDDFGCSVIDEWDGQTTYCATRCQRHGCAAGYHCAVDGTTCEPPKPVTVLPQRAHEAVSPGLCSAWSVSPLDFSSLAAAPSATRELYAHGAAGVLGVGVVTTLADGSFTLAAMRVAQGGAGAALVPLPVEDHASVVDVLASSDGGWLVAWLGDEVSSGQQRDLYLVRYDAGGRPVARTNAQQAGGCISVGANPAMPSGVDVAWCARDASGGASGGYGPEMIAVLGDVGPTSFPSPTAVGDSGGSFPSAWQAGFLYRLTRVAAENAGVDGPENRLCAWSADGAPTLDTLVPFVGWSAVGLAPDGKSGLLVSSGAVVFEGASTETVVETDSVFQAPAVVGTLAGAVVAGIDDAPSDGGGQPVLELAEVTREGARSPIAHAALPVDRRAFPEAWGGVLVSLAGTPDGGSFVVVTSGGAQVVGALFTCTGRSS